MGLIINEEKTQLQELEESVNGLDAYQDIGEFVRFNDRPKKEVEEFQKEQKSGEQKKYHRDVADFKNVQVFDLEGKRG